MDAQSVFDSLNNELKRKNLKRQIVICGGAALISIGIISRQTQDVDVIGPKIDPELSQIANSLAKKLNLQLGWLNNGPESLADDLPKGWENRTSTVFNGSNLTVKSLGRMDLILSKIYAACDRVEDIEDIVNLKPSKEELQEAKTWVLEKDAAEIWPSIVKATFEEIQKRIRN